MELKHTILKLLVENKHESFSIREISQKLGIDYKNTYVAIQKISDSVAIEKKSKSSFISFKPIFTADILLVETQRRKAIEKKIDLLLKDMDTCDHPFFIPVLFGSYAKKTNTKHSDIDLCIIHDNQEEVAPLLRKISIHPTVEIHDFNHKDFINMLKTTDFTVGKQIVEHGIPLKNVELYYEVIKHGQYAHRRGETKFRPVLEGSTIA